MRKITLLTLLWLLFLACAGGRDTNLLQGEALGTTYQIKYFSRPPVLTKPVMDSLIEVINNSMSTYREDSDISRINRGDSLVVVDEHFRKVFRYSQRVFKESDGFFDPTVGNLVNAYGFGPETLPRELDWATLDSLRNLVGFDKLSLDESGRIAKQIPGLYLDFNAIAKGYAIDLIASYLEGQGVEDFLVELGGELVARGRNLEKDSPWIVAIEDPRMARGERRLQAILELHDQAMATSGNYRKFRRDSDGGIFVHTINPRTGKAEKSNLLSATVLAENCSLADGYATAFMAMGLERSRDLVQDLEHVEGYFIYAGKGDSLEVYASEGFQRFLRE